MKRVPVCKALMIAVLLGVLPTGQGVLAQSPILVDPARVHPVLAAQAMVVSQEARATRIGVDVLRRGGNAVDAAVAVGFALAVTLPRAGNLGGGGFMVVYLADRQQALAIDYRETAPKAAHPAMFLDRSGEPDPVLSRDSALGIGVPGTVAGLSEAHRLYGSGRFSLAELIAPAIILARDGIPVELDLADSLKAIRPRLAKWPSSAAIFYPDGALPPTLRQPDLARSLEAIAQQGPSAFYEGAVSEKLVAAIQTAGGIMTRDDLRSYRPVIRDVVRGQYRGFDVLSMPPPSSGGVHLIQLLNILEAYDLKAMGHNSAASLHIMVEAMKRVYADRARFMGDPDVVSVPVKGLVAKTYAARLRESLSEVRATPSKEVAAGDPLRHEGEQTTHFSIVDAQGNAVANTYTLNFSYGLGLVADGTGILLNNELDDFAAKAGASNGFGLVQGAANLPGPGKRPLSSMSPTIVLKDGKVQMVTGSPGGSRIITLVLQNILNVVDHGMNVAEAVLAPRVHHQWLPDVVDYEGGISIDTLNLLSGKGHALAARPAFGSVNAILRHSTGWTGAADSRQKGTLADGF